MKPNHITIATRESPLALWQANWVKQQLVLLHPELTVSLLGMTTQADRMLETALNQIGGKGLFVKELEEALIDGRADIAVHSMKDVPMVLPLGLCMPVLCAREEPRDALVSNEFHTLAALPQGAKIGTASLRRQSQLRAYRPDLEIVNLRGNVNTRLQKLDRGDFAAIILAAAGLKRLGMENRIREYLDIDLSLPAVGQGVLGIECREDDVKVRELIAPLNDVAAHICVLAERAMCARLGGGCQVPIASYATLTQDQIHLRGLVARVDGTTVLFAEHIGHKANPEVIGLHVANSLLEQGADHILREITR